MDEIRFLLTMNKSIKRLIFHITFSIYEMNNIYAGIFKAMKIDYENELQYHVFSYYASHQRVSGLDTDFMRLLAHPVSLELNKCVSDFVVSILLTYLSLYQSSNSFIEKLISKKFEKVFFSSLGMINTEFDSYIDTTIRLFQKEYIKRPYLKSPSIINTPFYELFPDNYKKILEKVKKMDVKRENRNNI